jgi:hypothetical protein
MARRASFFRLNSRVATEDFMGAGARATTTSFGNDVAGQESAVALGESAIRRAG